MLHKPTNDRNIYDILIGISSIKFFPIFAIPLTSFISYSLLLLLLLLLLSSSSLSYHQCHNQHTLVFCFTQNRTLFYYTTAP